MSTAAAAPIAVPGLRRNMVTICAMTATIMQALDTTIANVALPYMQGIAVGVAGPDQLGADLLHRRGCDHDRAGGLDRQPLRPQAHLHHLLGRLHLRVGAVRPRAGHQPDGAVPPAAGHVRRGIGAAVAGGDARLLLAARTRQGDVDLGHGRDDGSDHGAVTGRVADRNLFLALGVLRQPAVRHLHGARPAGLHGRDQKEPRTALRLVRIRSARGRHRLVADRARPRRTTRLAGIQRDHRRAHRLGRRLLLFLRAFVHDRKAVHPVRDLQGPEFRRRLRIHGGDGAGAVLDHGAVVALSAERHRLSDHHRGPAAGDARLRHLRRHDAGRTHDAIYRGAHADHQRAFA